MTHITDDTILGDPIPQNTGTGARSRVTPGTTVPLAAADDATGGQIAHGADTQNAIGGHLG